MQMKMVVCYFVLAFYALKIVGWELQWTALKDVVFIEHCNIFDYVGQSKKYIPGCSILRLIMLLEILIIGYFVYMFVYV